MKISYCGKFDVSVLESVYSIVEWAVF